MGPLSLHKSVQKRRKKKAKKLFSSSKTHFPPITVYLRFWQDVESLRCKHRSSVLPPSVNSGSRIIETPRWLGKASFALSQWRHSIGVYANHWHLCEATKWQAGRRRTLPDCPTNRSANRKPDPRGGGEGGFAGGLALWVIWQTRKEGRGGTRDKWDGRLWAQQDYSLQKRSTASWTLGGGSLFRLAVAARNPGGNDKSVETGRGVALKWILEGGKSEKLKKELEDFTGGLKN